MRGLFAFLALVALVACDGPPEQEPPVIEIPVIQTPADLAARTLPLDEYIETPGSRKTVDKAINILGRECVRRFGIDWPVTQADQEPDRRQHARRYGILDPQYGYHPPPAPPEVRPPDQWPSLSSEQAAVWTGQGQQTVGGVQVPEGGCAAEAMRTLAAGAPAAPALQPQQLANEALKRATEDKRVQAAFAKWSECMRRQNLNFASPWDINDDPRWHSSPEPAEPELAAARTDVACRREVNLVGTWYAVEKSYQQRIVDQNATDLTKIREVIAAQNKAAAKIVGS